jgi:hypothetical protein
VNFASGVGEELTSRRLVPSSQIRWVMLEGIAIFLDLRAGTYVMLDASASASWERVARAPSGAEELDPRDWEFSRECVERGYLEAAESASAAPRRVLGPPRLPLSVYALYALVMTARALATNGFTTLYRRYATFSSSLTHSPDAGARLSQAEAAIGFAENFFTGSVAPNDCLPRSLAIYRILKYAGLQPEHRIGVRLHPFEAHAWVECEGRVIRDTLPYVREFAVIARLT